MPAGTEKNPDADFTSISDAEIRCSHLCVCGTAWNLCRDPRPYSSRCAGDCAVGSCLYLGARLRSSTTAMGMGPGCRAVGSAAAAQGLSAAELEAVSRTNLGVWIGLCNRDGRLLLR